MTRSLRFIRSSAIALGIATIAVLDAPAVFQPTAAIAHEVKEEVARISVNGVGDVNVAPDMAVIQLGVLREAETAREALDANNAAMAEVAAAMREAGIDGRDLQTSNFQIQPRYVYHRPKQGEEQKPPRIVGYTVSNMLTVRIRDLDNLGAVLDRSVTLGVNAGGSIRFTNDDPSAAIREARAAAMRDAVDRATTLVEAAGVTLGPIVSITESFSEPRPMPIAQARMAADAIAESVPVEAGENEYTVTVSATWEIAQ